MQFYQDGVNTTLLEKILEQDDPKILQGWIQLACEVEKHKQIVKLI